MDDIEKELKLIQLQRERLALERELALRAVGTAAGAMASGVAGPVKSLGKSFARWWKVLALLAALTAAVFGGIAWKQQRESELWDAARAEKQRAWNAGKDERISQECPESRYSCSTAGSTDPLIAQYVCSRLDSDRASCHARAFEEYARRVPIQY